MGVDGTRHDERQAPMKRMFLFVCLQEAEK